MLFMLFIHRRKKKKEDKEKNLLICMAPLFKCSLKNDYVQIMFKVTQSWMKSSLVSKGFPV